MPGIAMTELQSLIERRDGPCVSLYMPTERAGGDPKQNAIRFKNLLTRANESLEETGLRAAEAEALLGPATKLLDESIFWQRQSDGLALFVSDGFFLGYRQPLQFEETVLVGPRFHIKPLLPLISGDGRFYVVALSRAEVRVLQGTHFSVDQLEIEDVPDSLADAMKYDEFEEQIQFHTATAPRAHGSRRAIFHGHGAGHDDESDSILRYFRQVDKGLNEILNSSHAPLIVAALEHLHPIYAEANTYPHLLEAGVMGNPDPLTTKELHQRAWAVVRPYFEAKQRQAAEQVRVALGTGMASADINVVVPAAASGRVATLFIDPNRQAWGRLDRQTLELERDQVASSENEELIDLAAVHTLRQSGTVYAVEPGDMPGEGSVAAVFRY